ncbi:MAG: glycosyltransferase, partial [Olleya sp.]
LKKQLGIKSENYVYIFVGRIVKDKGINEVIESFVQVNLENPNTKLVLVGPFEADLDPIKPENFKEIKNNKNIIEIGYVNDVRPYFLIANTLVFPSYREGFPNVVMQAGAMGLPSIVSNINGCNEIIEDKKNGLIIPVKDAVSLTARMKELLLNQDLYLKLKENSRVSIQDRYEQNFIWQEILKEYKQLEDV